MRLRKTLFILPNLFTLSNVFCGVYAIFLCGKGSHSGVLQAAWLVVFSMLFDTLDGRVARLTRTQSAFGVQLDSLADIVSFGVAPAVLWYTWSLQSLGFGGVLLAFMYVGCGAIRLARFNVMATASGGRPRKPGQYIRGLPIPVAAGMLVSLVIASDAAGTSISSSTTVMAGVSALLSALMVSAIRFRSFKNLQLTWRTILVFALIAGSTGLLAVRSHPAVAIIWVLSSYVLLALLESAVRLSIRGVQKGRARRNALSESRFGEAGLAESGFGSDPPAADSGS